MTSSEAELSATLERLTPTALMAAYDLLSAWGIDHATQARLLMGDADADTAQYLLCVEQAGAGQPVETLSIEQMTRASLLIQIGVLIDGLLGFTHSSSWALRVSDQPLWAGRCPVDYLLDGGLPAFREVHHHLMSVTL